jgi:DNA-binding NarL/FixJ family response regulator
VQTGVQLYTSLSAEEEKRLATSISKRWPEKVVAWFVPNHQDPKEALTKHPIATLTNRETEILIEIAQGKSNPQIADKFNIEIGTVKTHVERLLSKLKVDNRSKASAIA